MKYWIRVTRDQRGAVIALYSPDLKIELLKTARELSFGSQGLGVLEERKDLAEGFKDPLVTVEPVSDFRTFAQIQLTACVSEMHNPFLSPKKRNQLKNIALTPLEHWEPIEVNIKGNCKCCEVFLPRLGQVLNFTCYFSNGFITYMALRIVSNSQESDGSLALSLTGTFIGTTVSLIVYLASGATRALAKIGENIDKICLFKLDNLIKFLNYNPKYACISSLAICCNFMAIFVSSLRLDQELTLLGEKFIKLDPNVSEAEHQFYSTLIKWLAINPFLISGAYTVAAFQTDFLIKFVKAHVETSIAPRPVDHGSIRQDTAVGSSGNLLDSGNLKSEEYGPSMTDEEQLPLRNSFPPSNEGGGGALHFAYGKSRNAPIPVNTVRTHSSIYPRCAIL